MRRLVLSLMLALATVLVIANIGFAQATPQFGMGFKTLADLIPQVVGVPTASEQYNPLTGQAMQPTTVGLMVWTKDDNVTAFTNGATTWVLGPFGLQQRANDVRFAWERPSSPIADLNIAGGLSPALEGAINELDTVPSGQSLLAAAAGHEVTIRTAPLPSGILGSFAPAANLVTIASQLDSAPAEVRAAVLAHELQHSVDLLAEGEPQTSAQCYNVEARAFSRQAHVWGQLWGGNLPPDSNPLYAEMNDVARTLATNPQAFVTELVARYRSECGPIR